LGVEEDENLYSKSLPDADFLSSHARQRANTIQSDAGSPKVIETETEAEQPALPTVFKWDGGGKQVYISGTFSDWKALPMVKSHGDFVTIINLPEGEHQFKFFVDGIWKHDAKLVSR